jgi:phage terminase large subunit GpA-like protein
MDIIEQAIRDACTPADRRPPWKWAEDYCYVATSPFPGKWRSDNSPWVKELMESFADGVVKTISVMCSAQSAKTETMLVMLNWIISEDPGPTMWVTSNDDEALKFCIERLMPTLNSCDKVRELMPKNLTGSIDRRKAKAQEIHFPRMTLEVIGSNSESKLQSKPRRWLLMDEVRNWPDGALPMVLKRTRAYYNAKRIIISTPKDQHDAVHQNFIQGDQRHWHISCPKCGHDQVMTWEKIKWDENGVTRPNGLWDFDEMAKTIRFECEKNKCQITDNPVDRRHFARNGKWVPHNRLAPKHYRSYCWNALIPTWVRWRDLVEEFINANKALSWGDPEPLKTFVNETLGEPWEDRMQWGDDSAYLEARKADYRMGEAWADEKTRFIGVDVQKDYLRYVVRAFADGGRSRLIDYGTLKNFDDLKGKIAELHVDPDNVILDAAHKTPDVYKAVIDSGYTWKPFWGDDRVYFTLKGVKSVWTVNTVDPFIGTRYEGRAQPIRLFHWSNPSIKDTLMMMMQGKSSQWEIPKHVGQDYVLEVTAEYRQEVVDLRGQIRYKYARKRKENHAFDCECMILTAAIINRLVGLPEPLERAPVEPMAKEETFAAL